MVVAPGQGAQRPGFLEPWLDVDGVRDRITWLSAVADVDLVGHGTTSDAETIRDTAVAQPLLVAAGLLAWQVVAARAPSPVADATAGHSVGELTAAGVAGVLTDEQAVVLVRERGRLMAEAAARTPTGMTAVLGGDTDEVLASLARHGLVPANVNGAGQVVAAGTLAQLASLAADPPARARLRPLEVAGAFHTEHMAPARDALRALTRGMRPTDASVTVLSNRDGSAVSGGADVLTRLVEQVATPVRWDACMAGMAKLDATGMLELPPAGTLTGLAKRALPGVATFALTSPDQLDDAVSFVAEHVGAASDRATPGSAA